MCIMRGITENGCVRITPTALKCLWNACGKTCRRSANWKTYSVRETERVSAAISLVESTLYGERKPAYEKVEPLLHFHNTIENRIRTYMHPVAWYLKRWLWSRSNPL